MADGSIVPAIGYRPVNIGMITLKDVRYVPQFKNTRLVSIVRSTAVGEVGTIRATGYPGTQE